MDILPAIDLRDGKAVRLQRGDYRRQTTYSDDPCEIARQFADAGAEWIHVVDLDAARTGRAANLSTVANIRNSVDVKIELGGGVRSEQAIDARLDEGLDRVVIGSAALKNWKWFTEFLRLRGDVAGRIALGLDAREGHLTAEGWTEQTELRAVDLARKVSGSSLGAIVFTDIARDGMLTGVNVDATAEIIAATDVPVIASGGVASLDDIITCRDAGCAGAVVGKAWYEGRIDLQAAIAAARQ